MQIKEQHLIETDKAKIKSLSHQTKKSTKSGKHDLHKKRRKQTEIAQDGHWDVMTKSLHKEARTKLQREMRRAKRRK